LFARLPLDTAYLIPAVPLVIVLLAQRLPRTAFAALCVALLASPRLLKVRLVEGRDEPTSAAIRPFFVGGQTLVLDVLRGPAFESQYRRIRMTRERDRILEQARKLSGQNVLVVHEWTPIIRTTLNGTALGTSAFVPSLDFAQARQLQARGVTVVDLSR